MKTRTPRVRTLVNEAVRLERSGATRQALEQYLTAWPLLRCRALAERIDALSKALAPTLPVVDVTAAGGFKPAIAKRVEASSPLDVGPVLQALQARKRDAGALFVAQQLVSLLRRHPDDPRLTQAAWESCRSLQVSHATAEGRAVFAELCTRALALRDPRHASPLLDVAASLSLFPSRDARAEADRAKVRTAAEAVEAEDEPNEPKWLVDALSAATNRKPQPLSALLESVYAAPEDVERRLVYADALQEAGDPRGEFIVLQCQREVGGAVSAREKTLLRNHEHAWVGKADPGIERQGLEFRRGFLSVANVKWAHVLEGPEWATLEALALPPLYGAEDQQRVAAFLRRRDLRVLRALWLDLSSVRLESKLPSVTCLGVLGELSAGELAFFPNLRRLEANTLDATLVKRLSTQQKLDAVQLYSSAALPLLRGVVPQVELSTRLGLAKPFCPVSCVFRGERLDQLEVGAHARSVTESVVGFVQQWVAELPRGFVSTLTLGPEVARPWLQRALQPLLKKGVRARQATVELPRWQDFA